MYRLIGYMYTTECHRYEVVYTVETETELYNRLVPGGIATCVRSSRVWKANSSSCACTICSMYQKGLSKVAEMEFLKTLCRKCLLMNELDCVEWNGAGSNIRELPKFTLVYLTEELVNWIAHLGRAWQTSVSNNRPRHKAMHCLTKLRPFTALRASLCTCAHGQATKCMNSSWSFWTLQNTVRSP